MQMNIQLMIRWYKRIEEKSCYNHNFYQIKEDLCGGTVIHRVDNGTVIYPNVLEEVCHEDDNYYTFALGDFVGKKFVPVIEWDSDYGCNGIKDLFEQEVAK